MPGIQPIANGESGFSVRAKINQIIALAALGIVTPADLTDLLDFVPPGVPTGLTITSTAVPPAMTVAWDFNPETDFLYYDLQIKESSGPFIGFQTSAERQIVTVKPNTTYTAKVRAVDRSGNVSNYCTAVSHTTARDTIPPAMPIGLASVAGLDSIWLTWIANTESDLAGYEIYESGSNTTPLISATPSWSTLSNNFTRSGLPMETQLYLWVRAVDTSGNVSPWSAPVNDKTGKIRSEIKVALSGVTFQPGQAPAGNRLTWTAGSISYGVAGDVPTVQALPTGQVDWTAGTVYVCYTPGDTAITTTASLVTLYANNSVILGIYKGGTDFQAVLGKAFMDGGLVLAQTIGANQLVTNAAVITGTAQIADAIITNAKVLSLSAAKLQAGTALLGSLTVDGRSLSAAASTQVLYDTMRGSPNWLNVNGTGTYSFVTTTNVGSTTGNALIANPATGVQWLVSQDQVPFDPAKLYKVTFRVLRFSGAATGIMYLGAVGVAADGVTPVDYSGAAVWGGIYCSALGVVQSAVPTAFTDYVGYIKGRAAAGTQVVGTVAVPAKLHNNVRFIRPIAIFNAATSDAQMFMDSVKIEVVNEAVAELVNAGTVRIDPGKITITGGTTLSTWISPSGTYMDGQMISVGSITADKAVFGQRGVTLEGIEFQSNSPSANRVSWSAGTVKYIGDDGNIATFNITGSNTAWSSGTLYVYYVTGSSALAASATVATAFQTDRIVLATYKGGTDLVVNFGRTIIDGSKIATGSITATQADIASFRTSILVAGVINAGMISVATLSAITGNVGTLTAGIVQSTDGKVVFDLNNSRLLMSD
ncbi:hypothetical protein BPNPMPFG_002524 [Mesorhizobium sp. AR07]|uniref:hypothetical protein n=1 Tax=Mesorhizobium sp. AR07 TaxID=2865838 RepID=UPI0021607295|nr:hypothetical protein [Mesorhizobium sp. AR07]UVK46814.1 hypothetical protein BPNPMPFG_002524 [Mesorhizobium sp. AR07]